MIAIEQKANRGKLLAAIAVLAMVACAFAAILPADDSTALPANFPDAEKGVITVSEDLTLNGNATITDRLVINGTLTVPAGYTLNVNYAFNAAGQSAITFGANGKLVVSAGATVSINVSNATGYTPAADAGNHVFTGATGYGDAAIVVNGTMSVSSDAAVKGVTNYGTRMIQVASTGTFTSNANGYQTVYFDVNGGTVDITVKDGRVAAYIDVADKGTFSVGGTNATATEDNKFILEAYSANVAAESTLNIEGKATIYDGDTASAVSGMTTKQIVNAGTVNVTANGSLQVPAKTTYNTENGTTNVSGSIDISGTATGTISCSEDGVAIIGEDVTDVSKLVIDGGVIQNNSEVKPILESGVEYTALDNNDQKEYRYIAVNKRTADGYIVVLGVNAVMYQPGVYYQGDSNSVKVDFYGLFGADGKRIDAASYDFLEVNKIYELPENAMANNSDYGTVTDVGTYTMRIALSYGPGPDPSYTTVVYGDFRILPVEYTATVTVEGGWTEGEYDLDTNGPTLTVKDNNGKEVPSDQYTYAYEFYTDAALTELADVQDISLLPAGNYWMKTTVTMNDKNITVGNVATVNFTVNPDVLDSTVEFNPITDAEILGIDPTFIQENIIFTVGEITSNKADVAVTGMIYQVTDSSALPESWKMTNTGYYLAFYITAADGVDLTATGAVTPKQGTYADITPEDAAKNVKYFVYYLGNNLATTTSQVITVDLDGDGAKYASTQYNFTFTNINKLHLILVDSGNNVNYETYVDNEQTIILPNGAGPGFNYWVTEDGSPVKSFNAGSHMTVTTAFDTVGADGAVGADNTVTLTADYTETSVTTPTDYATTVYIGVTKENNQAVINLGGVTADGKVGAIPAGQLTIDFWYVEWNNDLQDFVTTHGTAIIRDVGDNESIIYLSASMFGLDDLTTLVSIDATFSAENATGENDFMYTPVMVVPEIEA